MLGSISHTKSATLRRHHLCAKVEKLAETPQRVSSSENLGLRATLDARNPSLIVGMKPQITSRLVLLATFSRAAEMHDLSNSGSQRGEARLDSRRCPALLFSRLLSQVSSRDFLCELQRGLVIRA